MMIKTNKIKDFKDSNIIKSTKELERISYDLFYNCQRADNPEDTRMYSNEWQKHQDTFWVNKEELIDYLYGLMRNDGETGEFSIMFKEFEKNYPSLQKYIEEGQYKGIIGFCIYDDEELGVRGYVDITPGEFIKIINNTVDKQRVKDFLARFEEAFDEAEGAPSGVLVSFYKEFGLEDGDEE